MDVFKMFDFSWKHPIRSIKYFFRALRWSRQRVKKGYCDWDVMDIDTKYEFEYSEELEEKRTKHSLFLENTFSTCGFEIWKNAKGLMI